jgi:hypothetical protein
MLGCFVRLAFGAEASFGGAVTRKAKRLMWWRLVSSWHVGNPPFSCYSILVMSTSQNDGDKQPTPPDASTVILLLTTIGDTTWRMFVPTIGLTVLGLLADKWLHTTPWIMILGIITGAYLAYVLVKRQIKRVKE